MFKSLRDEVIALNSDVNNISNSEKAKKLRSKLMSIGVPLAVFGFVGLFVCFMLFATAGFDAFGVNGFSARVLIPFALIIPCTVVGGIGSDLVSIALKIVVTGVVSSFAEKVVGKSCPKCGNRIEPNETYCDKCKKDAKFKCSQCGASYSSKEGFCEYCGSRVE